MHYIALAFFFQNDHLLSCLVLDFCRWSFYFNFFICYPFISYSQILYDSTFKFFYSGTKLLRFSEMYQLRCQISIPNSGILNFCIISWFVALDHRWDERCLAKRLKTLVQGPRSENSVGESATGTQVDKEKRLHIDVRAQRIEAQRSSHR